ncbi:hypothetical protein EW146_g632 [Bondarzewia mesenterica]|uniref:Major facilitator superfamily (MFS) profile domain-containing protein n=1 Tax=Bondarzewia mesenterica TaxID=1095465 RepID=A0A4S4M6D3_9AGAM|nr:hypothetical protein EW146_g632 [Bondarzewia mesenterica]
MSHSVISSTSATAAPSLHSDADKEAQRVKASEAHPSEVDEQSPYFKSRAHEALFIFIVIISQLITQANLGNTIVPIAQISRGLNLPPDNANQQSWCTVGAFVLITRRLGDLYGRKTFIILGWIWLAIFKIVTGFAPNAVVYDVFRALSGIGPYILMPNSSALLGMAWPNPNSFIQRQRKTLAFALFGAIAPMGYVVGAVWGALFGQLGVRWGWIYWSMAIFSVFMAVASWLVIPSDLNKKSDGTVDYLGSFLGVGALVLIFVSINGAIMFGWDSTKTIVLLVVGVLFLALFVFIELKVPFPILPMRVFRSPTFVAISISLCLGWMSFGMYQYYLPHFLMRFRDLSELHVGYQFLPIVVVGPVAASIAVFGLTRLPPVIIFGASMFCFMVGQLLLALTPPHQTYWAMTFPTIIIICFGPDLSFACASLIASDALSHEEQGVAGSFINTVVNFSIALGLAIAGNVESAVNDGGNDILKGYRAAWWCGCAFAGTGLVMTIIFSKEMNKRHEHSVH